MEVPGLGSDEQPAHQRRVAPDFNLQGDREEAEYGDVCAMYRYGHACGDSEAGKHWLCDTAQHGCVSAIHECALASDDPREATHWLREAAEEGYGPAMLDYAQACEDVDERAYWLHRAARRIQRHQATP